jgi:hypothetical protein
VRAQRSLALRAVACAFALGVAACSSPPLTDPRYRATESVLEVAAALRLHIEEDTYRRPPARDFTGKNIYRASFNRLENLEATNASKLSSGYLQDVIWFSMGRAVERIQGYDLAAKLYARVAALDSDLAPNAREGQRICERLRDASGQTPAGDAVPQKALDVFAKRTAGLEKLFDDARETHYAFIAREELERTDLERARYFGARRRLEPRLDTIALQSYQDLVQNHPESKNRNRNLLELARFYEELARDYVQACAPVALCFDPATFDEFAFGAQRVYESVAQQDGAVEKIEAARRLEALIAFVLQVYEDKLPGDARG